MLVVLLVCVVFWWGAVVCSPGRFPQPYPRTPYTELLERRTAVILSETRTISYTVTATIDQVRDHYTWEMQWTCERGSIRRLTPIAPGALHYHGGCFIKGWKNGGYTFYPTGGYHFETVQEITIDAYLRPDGTIEVIHIEDFAQSC